MERSNWFRWAAKAEEDEDKQDDQKQDEDQQQVDPSGPFVTQQQFGDLTSKIDQLAGAFLGRQEPASEPPPKKELPPVEDVSDDEIEAAWAAADESGDQVDIRKARRLEEKRYNARFERYQRSQDEKFESLQTQGMNMFGQINNRMATDMLKSQKYYTYVEKTVQDRLKDVPAGQLTPEVAKHIYDMAVGSQIDEIQQKEGERAAREKAAKVVPEGTQGNGRGHQTDERGTFISVFGENLAGDSATWNGQPLWSKNHDSPDRFAKNLGYNDADHYARVSQWVMQIEPCRECFQDILPNEDHNCPVGSMGGGGLIHFPRELA